MVSRPDIIRGALGVGEKHYTILRLHGYRGASRHPLSIGFAALAVSFSAQDFKMDVI